MKTKAHKLLAMPVTKWEAGLIKTRGQTVGALQEIESELSALIQRATLLHGYVAHRFNTGCGDQGHSDSAKVANRQLVKVRKAVGFSYPERTALSIP